MNLKQAALVAVHGAGAAIGFYFRRFLTEQFLNLISAAGSRIIGAFKSTNILKESSMLEGKEVDQKIGNVGNVTVDVAGDAANIGKTEAALNLALNHDLIPSLPGVLSVEGSVNLKLKADPVVLALHEMQKLNSPFAKMVADSLAKLRAGSSLDAHVQAAVDAHVA